MHERRKVTYSFSSADGSVSLSPGMTRSPGAGRVQTGRSLVPFCSFRYSEWERLRSASSHNVGHEDTVQSEGFLVFCFFWLRWVFAAVCRLFSSWGEQGLLFVVVRGLLIAVASLVAEHGL